MHYMLLHFPLRHYAVHWFSMRNEDLGIAQPVVAELFGLTRPSETAVTCSQSD